MGYMKWLRYPLLFLAVIFIPTSLATLFIELPVFLSFSDPYRWSFLFSLIGYLLGYLLVYGFTGAINHSFHLGVYSKRMRTTYLVTNAIVAALVFFILGYSMMLLFAGQLFTPATAIIFIGLPWIGVQLLLLQFFVRSERLYR